LRGYWANQLRQSLLERSIDQLKGLGHFLELEQNQRKSLGLGQHQQEVPELHKMKIQMHELGAKGSAVSGKRILIDSA
jgi:adenylate cyclase class IV